jgi:large subunit ribosomal protein L24
MNRQKFHVRKGDRVEVICGDNKGSQGTILEVQSKNQRVLIEGVNMVKKSVRPSQDKPQGGFLEKEAPVHISNVKLLERSK